MPWNQKEAGEAEIGSDIFVRSLLFALLLPLALCKKSSVSASPVRPPLDPLSPLSTSNTLSLDSGRQLRGLCWVLVWFGFPLLPPCSPPHLGLRKTIYLLLSSLNSLIAQIDASHWSAGSHFISAVVTILGCPAVRWRGSHRHSQGSCAPGLSLLVRSSPANVLLLLVDSRARRDIRAGRPLCR